MTKDMWCLIVRFMLVMVNFAIGSGLHPKVMQTALRKDLEKELKTMESLDERMENLDEKVLAIYPPVSRKAG